MILGEFNDEVAIRFGVFVAVLIAMASAEALWPRRERTLSRARRWPANGGIVVLASALIRLLAWLAKLVSLPLVAVAAAVLAEGNGWGVLNLIALPNWLEIAIALVVLDFSIWLQHLLAHRIPLLWRIHRMHHADRDFDVTTALRFHPLEIALSMLYKVAWVLILGAPVWAVIAFEIILNALAMFNHANVALPAVVDCILRVALVTPDMHRVHHSVRPGEHHANFGFNLSIWDRLFATYVAQPQDGHHGMTIGLPEFQTDQPAQLGWSLKLPFQKTTSTPGP